MPLISRRLLASRGRLTAGEPQALTCAVCGGPGELSYAASLRQLPPSLAAKFVTLAADDDATRAFLASFPPRGPLARASLWLRLAAAVWARRVVSRTDANAYLGLGSMFVLSTSHAATLLGRGPPPWRPRGALLDIGAGDGGVTSSLAPLFASVTATETSGPMLARLRRRGFDAALDAGGLEGLAATAIAAGARLSDGRWDAVALLNVLDRCNAPRTLLRSLHGLLVPGTGRLVLAVVLPFKPHVESGPRFSAPSEQLGLPRTGSFEASLAALVARVIIPAGYRVESVSRVPYLSHGDLSRPVYVLDDALLVLSSAVNDPEPAAARGGKDLDDLDLPPGLI